MTANACEPLLGAHEYSNRCSVDQIQTGRTASFTEHQLGLLLATAGVCVMIPDGTLLKVIFAPASTAALWRMSLTGVSLSCIQLARYGRGWLAAVYCMGRWGVAVSLLGGASNMLFVEAVKSTTVANALLIMSTSSFWAALLGRVALGTPVRPCTLAAMPVVFGGVAVSVSAGLQASGHLGDALALCISFLGATRRTMLRYRADVDMQPAMAMGNLLFSAMLFASGVPWEVATHDVLPIAVLGGIIMPVAITLTTAGAQLLPSAESSLLMCIETVCSPVLAHYVVGDVVATQTWIGLAVVVSALVAHSAWQLAWPVKSSYVGRVQSR